MFETVMMGLRLKQGLSRSLFHERFGMMPEEAYSEAVKKLEREGMLVREQDSLRCSDRGFPLLNSILVEFLD